MLEERCRVLKIQDADILCRRSDGWVYAKWKNDPGAETQSRTWEGAVLELLLQRHPLVYFEKDVPTPMGEDVPGLKKIRAKEEEQRAEELVTA